MSEQVRIAQALVGRAPARLKAYGLGSCLAVALYDPALQIGALGHMLLPSHPASEAEESAGKYVDAGIRRMVELLEEAGAEGAGLVARIAGGANMFESAYQTLINSIGARNARSARATLEALGIPLAGEDVGGNRGRTVEFDLATGMLMVYCARDDSKLQI